MGATPNREARWLHGDLHPRNIIASEGEIVGVIDWGDLCRGDPATDLSAAWTVVPPASRARFWVAYGREDRALVSRAHGWAVFFAVALATTPEERHRRMGERLLASVVS